MYSYLNTVFIQIRHIYTKKIEIYKRCFAILGVPDSADQNTVRRAYIELVKKVHPDSGHSEASASKFQEVDDAFKILQEKFAKNRRGIDDDEVNVFDIRHTAPQHRQYLTFDGIGVGTPSQRQKQYQTVKAVKAQERVLDHRLQKAQAGEHTLMKKSSQRNHDIRTKYGFERVVEDLIQEAISKGDFNNLSGTGKPLSNAQSQNPYLDFTTHKLNKILIDNGFTPQWISLQREIREEIIALRHNLVKIRSEFTSDIDNETAMQKWQLSICNYEKTVEIINKKIDRYNLLVPLLNNQMVRIKLNEISESVLMDKSIVYSGKKSENVPKRKNTDEQKNSNILSFFSSLF